MSCPDTRFFLGRLRPMTNLKTRVILCGLVLPCQFRAFESLIRQIADCSPLTVFLALSSALCPLLFSIIALRFALCALRFAVCWSALIGVNLRLKILLFSCSIPSSVCLLRLCGEKPVYENRRESAVKFLSKSNRQIGFVFAICQQKT